MAIVVVNKHTHTPTELDVYIGRGSPLGNPYKLSDYSREVSISLYAVEISQCISTKANTKNLNYQGVKDLLNRIWWMNRYEGQCNLVCYCAPLACHGDVIKGILDAIDIK